MRINLGQNRKCPGAKEKGCIGVIVQQKKEGGGKGRRGNLLGQGRQNSPG